MITNNILRAVDLTQLIEIMTYSVGYFMDSVTVLLTVCCPKRNKNFSDAKSRLS